MGTLRTLSTPRHRHLRHSRHLRHLRHLTCLTRALMLARAGVYAGVGEPQTLDRPSADDVRFDDFFDIGLGDAAVPDGVRIDDHRRAVFALIETAGAVGANRAIQTA